MSNKGEVTYEVRADYSQLESDLEQANKKVEESVEKSAEKTVKIEKEKTQSIKKEQESVTQNHQKENQKQEKSSQSSAKTFKQLAKNIGTDIKSSFSDASERASKTIEKIKHPIKTVSTFTKEKASNIKSSMTNAFSNAKEKAVSGMEKTANAILHPVKTAKEASAAIKEHFSGAFDAIGESASKAAGGIAKGVGAGMLGAGAAVVAVGTMATNSAVSMDQAMNDFIASTGKGTEETERYQNVLENIYKNNYGEDFQDIADAMELVTKNLGDMDDSSLQSLTESAFALRDTFEYDITETTRAAKAMMDQFGISGEEAMNLIVAGNQKGLDYSGELLDSISEYSAQFAKVGLDADDMFKIFQKGAETGAWNLDKVGDAIKEMSIRVIDGSDTTKTGFETIGLNADEMAKKFAEGGESAKEAFQQTVEALAALEDPLAQDAAGVALFGTMWEDLGPEVVTALADIEDGAYATGEELNKIKEVKYDDLGSMFEGLTRAVEMLLLPLGEQLIPILSELIESIMPIVEDALPPFIDAVGDLIEQLAPMIADILPPLIDLFNQLLPPLMDLISAIMPILIDLILALMPPILEVVKALLPLIDLITTLLIPVIEILSAVFSEVFTGIADLVSSTINRITNIINGIISFIKNVFTGNWKGAWDDIVGIFKNIFGGIVDIVKFPLNSMIDNVNRFIKGINKIKIPDWVPGVGGKSIKLPTIPRLRVGMDYVPSDDFPALLHKGEAVLTAQENALYRSVGGFNGIMSAISERGYQDARNNTSKTIIIHNYMEVDGREVARSTAEYIGEQLPWEEL